MKKYIVIIAAMILSAAAATGKPAFRGIVTLSQPDGTEIQAKIHGDEFAHYVTDLQGRVLKQNSEGWWCYGIFSPDGTSHDSGEIAGTDAPGHILSASTYIPETALRLQAGERRRTVYERRMMQQNMTRTMTESADRRRILVILAEFADIRMNSKESDFRTLLSTGSKSAKKYLEDQFLGQCEFDFDISPIVTLSHNMAYYGANNEKGSDQRAAEAVSEACKLADEAGMDFSRYDEDGDGVVDNVFMFFAGKDEAEGGGEDCFWSHSWYLTAAGINLFLDGKRIDCYALSSELSYYRSSRKYLFTSIGTFCHEYSHTLGLMDMYDTDNESNGVADCLWGDTSLMDHGNYNDEGRTPPYYNAIDRDMLGIGQIEVLKPGKYVLEPINVSGRYLRYDTPNSGEYYLFECRSNAGWDKYAGGNGLAIYHIDKSGNKAGQSEYLNRNVSAIERWRYNEVNCNAKHQCADMIEAYPGATSISQIFFPYERSNSFSYASEPSFTFWSGTGSPIALGNIQKDGDNVTFTVSSVGSEIPADAVVEDKAIFQDAAIIRWNTVDQAAGEATVEWGRSGKEMTTLAVRPYGAGKFSVTLEGLEPTTAYKMVIYYVADGIKGKETEVNFTTRAQYRESYPFIYVRDTERNEDDSFPSGALIPLRVFNMTKKGSVEWKFNGRKITAGGNGYYSVSTSGELRADVSYEDGTSDIIVKKIIVK